MHATAFRAKVPPMTTAWQALFTTGRITIAALQEQQECIREIHSRLAPYLATPDGTPAAYTVRPAPLPEALDVKKRLVFGAVRVAECGNMVSPPLGETMALIGRDDCLARIDRARPMAL